MHGIIFKGLKDFVIETYDQETWAAICEAADAPRRLYLPVSTYPDEHLFELIEAAVELSGEETPDLLRAFGQSVIPSLVQTYGIHVDEDWTGLELVENVEEYIHEALRAKKISEFTPPAIETRRVDEATVLVEYGSDRMLCDVTMGLIEGIGEHYGEPLDVEEIACMHDDAPKCELVVTDAAAKYGELSSQRARVDGGVDPDER